MSNSPILAGGMSPPPALAAETHSIVIALSANHKADRREIRIKPGDTIVLGRASRSDVKGLSAQMNNTLFDNPVVSRKHAHLKTFAHEVTVADAHSMHGTAVNGQRLAPGRPFQLKSGDVIKLGDRVTHGKDMHDGVSLTFELVSQTLHMADMDLAVPARGYHAPSSNGSEYGSDIDSDFDEDCAIPSSDTTPEQARFKPTSQAPVTTAVAPQSQPRLIDLSQSDDEDDVIEVSSNPPAVTVVQDSVINDDLQFVAPSVYPAAAYPFNLDRSAIDDVVPSHVSGGPDRTFLHNTGHWQSMSKLDASFDMSDRNLEDSEDDAFESDEDEPSIEDSDCLSESDVSELSAGDSEPESSIKAPTDSYVRENESSYQAPLGWSFHTPASYAEFEKPNLPTASFAGTPLEPLPFPQKPRYDPVRGSQPPAQEMTFNSNTASKPSTMPAYSPVTVVPMEMTSSTSIINPWVAADCTPSGSMFAMSESLPQPSATFTIQNRGPLAPMTFAPAPPVYSYPVADESAAPGGNQETDSGHKRLDKSYNEITTAPISSSGASGVQIAMERPHKAHTKAMLKTEGTEEQNVEAVEITRKESAKTNTKKRKADQIANAGAIETPPHKTAKSPASRSERSRGFKAPVTATGVAKFAGGAVFGAIGTVAFLTSVYAEQLIEWLN